jgi:hypothetical protein
VDFNNPIELNRYGYTAGNPVNAFDPSGNNIEYSNSNHPARQQSEARAARIIRAVGKQVPKLVALIDIAFKVAAGLSTIEAKTQVLKLRVELLDGFSQFTPPEGFSLNAVYTFAVGRILETATNRVIKVVALNDFRWSALSNVTGMSMPTLENSIRSIVGQDTIIIRDLPGVTFSNSERHAEEIIMRWAIQQYGDAPTTYKVLSIAGSNQPYSNSPNSCTEILRDFKNGGYSDMFDTTIIV